jgi:hypothetical protein
MISTINKIKKKFNTKNKYLLILNQKIIINFKFEVTANLLFLFFYFIKESMEFFFFLK